MTAVWADIHVSAGDECEATYEHGSPGAIPAHVLVRWPGNEKAKLFIAADVDTLGQHIRQLQAVQIAVAHDQGVTIP